MRIMYQYRPDANHEAIRAAAMGAGCETVKTVRPGADYAVVPGGHHEADQVMSRLREVPGVTYAHVVTEDFK